jgi:hypothetical protein
MPPEGSYMAIAAHDHATHTNCVSEQAGGVYRVKLTNYGRVHQLRGIGSSRSSASSTVGTISGGLVGLVDREVTTQSVSPTHATLTRPHFPNTP